MTDISGDGIDPIQFDPMDELGSFADAYDGARNDPDRLVAEMREDDGFRIAMARADVRHHLLRWFQETGPGWQDDPRRSGSLGMDSVGTSWSFAGIHAEVGTFSGDLASGEKVDVVGFNGLLATGRGVTVHGFTVMTADEGRLAVHRHVDWTGLFGQLGLTLNWRIPIDDPDPEA